MVGIVTDLLNDSNSGARIRTMIDSTTFTIDQEIPAESTTSLFEIDNVFIPDDIFEEGEQSVCLVSTPTGTEMRTIVAAETEVEGNVIRVDEAFSSIDLEGAHVVMGPVSRFTHRCIVSDVQRVGQENSQLVLVDEAKEIFREMEARFG